MFLKRMFCLQNNVSMIFWYVDGYSSSVDQSKSKGKKIHDD